MKFINQSMRSKLLAVFLGLSLLVPGISFAENVTQRPSGLEMTTDALLVRPLSLVGTILGTGLFVVSLPFSALGGNVGEAADTLVVEPFKSTFFRCLGCSTSNDLDREVANIEQ